MTTTLLSATGRIEEITSLHDLAMKESQSAVSRAIRIGELLTEQKAELQHGEWIPWVEENLPFGIDQAGNYMRVYRNQDKLNSEPVRNLKEAVQMLATPKPKTETVSDFPEDGHVDTETGEILCDGDEDAQYVSVEYIPSEEITIEPVKNSKIFDRWDKVLKDLNAEIAECIQSNPVASWLHYPFYKQKMNQLRSLIKDAKPSRVCPECNGSNKDCDLCRGYGFLSVQADKLAATA